jgi:hypothetical protein
MPEGGWVTATWARQCPADAFSFAITPVSQTDAVRAMLVIAVARVGVEPTKSQRFELCRFAYCVPRRVSPLDGI